MGGNNSQVESQPDKVSNTPSTDSTPFTRPSFRPTKPESSPLNTTCILNPPPTSTSSHTRPNVVHSHSASEQPATSSWVEPYSHDVQFRLAHFFAALKDLSVHPERNSSLILRADPIDPPSSISTDEADDEEKHELENVLSSHLELGLGAEYGLQRVEELWNKLIPKQVSRDGKLNQRVIMYKRVKKSTTPQGMDEVDQKKQEEEGNTASVKRSTEEEDEREFGVVLMIPQVSTPEDIPFYHPSVQKIAFVYQPLPLPSTTSTKAAAVELPPTPTSEHPPSSADSAEPVKPVARLSIAYLPFPSRQSETDSSSTLSPTTKQVSIDGVDPRDTHTETMPAALPGNPVISGSLSIRQVRSPRKRSPLAAPPVGEDGTVSQEAQDAEIKPPATIMESELNGRDVPVILDHIGQNDGHHGGLGLSGATSPGEQSSTEPEVDPQEEAEAKAQAEQSAKKAKQASERTDRTCLALLERVYKQSYGDMTGYQKRMHHDVLVKKESFQDLYLELKERHRHLDSRASKPGRNKIEDVKRHVWKPTDASLPNDPSLPTADFSHYAAQDVAIASFLMLLWKDMYKPVTPSSSDTGNSARQWDSWGRPPGGFVDLGCGNGLLVHILTAEGYIGKGYELRARRTWPLYPPTTRDALVELPIAFPEWFPASLDEWYSDEWVKRSKEDCPIKEDCFIIGNHADEITPWIPLLSLLPARPVPSLSLPCCLHTLDGPFTPLVYTPPSHPATPDGGFGKGLEEGNSRYKAYLIWLGYCGLKCGWEWEREPLRIPSTKGWGIIARKRWAKDEDLRECREWAMEQVNEVRARGQFKIREKEGKASDH